MFLKLINGAGKSRQWLENCDQTLLVLASGKPELQKIMAAVNLFNCITKQPAEVSVEIWRITFYNMVRKTWNNNLVEVVEYYFPDLRLIAIGPLLYFTDIALTLPLNFLLTY